MHGISYDPDVDVGEISSLIERSSLSEAPISGSDF